MTKEQRYYIIGTAGHIDHGKTTMIKALTGINTDRLKEEQERGITIDLGFAFFESTDGRKYGIIDVPGHEKFIPNMLAGVHGLDVVMMVVAADDGVKPQTIEHFEILHLLKIPRAMFVITKIDMVDKKRIEEVREEIEILIFGSYLENSRIIPASGRTDEGLDDVRAEITRLVSEDIPTIDRPYFRLPIDRAFTITGFGTVVTGTIVSGTVKIDDEVSLVPTGKSLRIRNIEIHDENVSKGMTSQRAALNLAKVDKDEITRGMQLVSPQLSGQMFPRYYASLEMLKDKKSCRLKNFARAKLYTGTADTMVTLINISEDRFEPGGHYVVDMSFRDDLFVISGDRFILRDETNRTTIGGGEFILPSSIKKARISPSQLNSLNTFSTDNLQSRILSALEFDRRTFVSLGELSVLFNRKPDEISKSVTESKDAILSIKLKEKYVTLPSKLENMKKLCVEAIEIFHKENPEQPGIDKHELRGRLKRYFHDEAEIDKIWNMLISDGLLSDEGEFIRLSGFKIKLGDDDSEIAGKVLKLYSDISTNPPKVERLAELLNLDSNLIKKVFFGLTKSKMLVGLTSDVYLERKTYDDAVEKAIEYARKNGSITVKDFKDLVSTNRNLAVVILESMDKRGITSREENNRTLRKK
jgi:selenocysteine-specific elongation factor